MLDLFRRKAQSPLIQALILIIVIVFIFWGVGSGFLNNRTYAVRVNGEEIGFQAFQQAYDRLVDTYREQFGDLPPEFMEKLNLKQQAIRQLIQAALIRQGGARMGLMVSDTSIARRVQEMEVFQEDGHFSLERYKSILAQNRMTPKAFEDSLRGDLMVNQTIAAVERFAVVTDTEIELQSAFDNEEIRLGYAHLESRGFDGQVEVTDEALKDYFDKHQDRYLTEPAVRLSYLAFTAKDLGAREPEQGGQGQDQDEAGKAGDKNTDQAALSQEDRGRLFELAGAAYEAIINAGSLAAYGEESGQQVLTTELFTRGNPPPGITADPRFLAEAFRLKQGELSSLVETAQGYAIIFVDELKPPEVPPLDEVRQRVAADFRRDEARRLASEAAQALLDAARKDGKGLKKAAEELKYAYIETDFLRRHAAGKGGRPPAQVTDAAFARTLADPLADQVLPLGETFYVYTLLERRSPEVDLDQAGRERIRTQLLAAKQKRFLDAWLDMVQTDAKILLNPQFQE